MELEIRDVQSAATHLISEKGITLGRQGGGADLPVPERTVSSKHCRIFAKDGKWYLEDLRSSNGTFVNGARINAPMLLTPGVKFSLCRYTYEVARILGVAMSGSTAVLENAALVDAATELQSPRMMGDRSNATATAAAKEGLRDIPAGLRSNANQAFSVPTGDMKVNEFASQVGSPAADLASGSVNEPLPSIAPASGGAQFFMTAVPKAIAYYLAAIPRLALNPVGSVRQGIASPAFGAFSVPELIAWALPPNLLGVVVSFLATLIYTIVWGQIGASLFISPIIGVAVAVVASIITGLIWHPLMRWIVALLKGTTTDVSRSNYFVMMHTAIPLTTLAGAVGMFLAVVPVPFIGVVPVVIGLAANLLLTFIAYAWFKFFGVMKWVTVVLLVLGALSCVGAVMNLIGVVRAGVAQLKGGSAAVTEIVPSTAGASAGSVPASSVTPVDAKSIAVPAAAGGGVPVAPAAGGTAAEVPVPVQVPPPAQPTPPGPVGVMKVSDPAGIRASPSAGAGTAYQEYVRERDAVEAALDADPTLLKQRNVLALYQELHKTISKVKSKCGKPKGGKKGADKLDKRVADKLCEADLYDETHKQVSELYHLVGSR